MVASTEPVVNREISAGVQRSTIRLHRFPAHFVRSIGIHAGDIEVHAASIRGTRLRVEAARNGVGGHRGGVSTRRDARRREANPHEVGNKARRSTEKRHQRMSGRVNGGLSTYQSRCDCEGFARRSCLPRADIPCYHADGIGPLRCSSESTKTWYWYGSRGRPPQVRLLGPRCTETRGYRRQCR